MISTENTGSEQEQAAHKARLQRLLRRLLMALLLLLVVNGAYMLLTWVFGDVAGIEDLYLRSELQFLPTSGLVLLILLIVFLYIYRKRKKELKILSAAIRRVAASDYSSQIVYNPKDSMASIYRDFNHMSAELASVQFLKKDFINHFSHEFKTPLASINGFACLMLDRELDREEQKTYLNIIREESDRLARLAGNTILLTKLSSQEYTSACEHFDLGEQLRQCSIILSHEWLAKELNYSGELPRVDFLGNRELLQHLWLNLLGNAVKYTPRGGDISVSLSRQEDQAVVIITDSGEGMSEETLAHLFVPYYQGENVRAGQGLGLGLAICKQIITLCEGTITVKSRLGEGSSFTVTLPIRN